MALIDDIAHTRCECPLVLLCYYDARPVRKLNKSTTLIELLKFWSKVVLLEYYNMTLLQKTPARGRVCHIDDSAGCGNWRRTVATDMVLKITK